ncbi:MAG: hypothetical protein GY847_03990 [Proteobacteria bacterium]|nr:hypothetical protein [Pseudomonadota bacterium]
MPIKNPPAIRYCLLACISILFFNVNSAHGDQNSSLILLIEPQLDDVHGYQELRVAIEAHLGVCSTEVRLHRVQSLPRNPKAQATRARVWAKDQGASAIIWIDISRQTISLVFTDAKGNERTLKRRFRCISRNVGTCGDAIASVVNSALTSWVGYESCPQTEAPAPSVPAKDNELSPIELEELPWKEPEPFMHLMLNPGYGFIFFKGTGSFTHGPHLGIGAVWKKHYKLEVSSELVRPIVSDVSVNDSKMEFNRLPIWIVMGGVFPWKNWSFALSGGLVLDLNSIHKVNDSLFIDKVDNVRPGFATIVTVSYTILKWLAIWIESGVDIYTSRYKYIVSSEYNETLVIRNNLLQGRLALGVSLVWGVGKAGG